MGCSTSDLGQTRTSDQALARSVPRLITDLRRLQRLARFVPTSDSCTAAIRFDHLLGAREQRCRHFEGPSTYAASIRRRVQPLRRMLAQLREFAIVRAEETRCYELRGAHPAAW